MRAFQAPGGPGSLVDAPQPGWRETAGMPRGPSRPAISISRSLSRVIVTLRGVLDGSAAPRLRPLLWDLIDGQGNLDVLVDLEDVAVIDPAGIGLLVGTSERMRRRGGRIEFSGVDASGHSSLLRYGLTVAGQGAAGSGTATVPAG